MVRDHTLKELRSIKAGIDAQFEQWKLINLFFTFITFCVGILSAPLVFYIGQVLRMDDWVRSANNMIDSKRMEAAGLSAIESADYLSRRLEQDVGSTVETILKVVSGHYGQYVKIFVVLVIMFSFLVARYLWLAAAHHIVNQAFDEMSKDKL